MWIELFLCLVLAHLVADFVFQTSASCKSKAEKHWRSGHQYLHALIVSGLEWLVSWDLRFLCGKQRLCQQEQSDAGRPRGYQAF